MEASSDQEVQHVGVIAWMHVVGVSCAEPSWMLSTSSLLSELSYHSITII